MATLIIRNVDENTKARLMQQAAINGRSTEAEVRDILKKATAQSTWVAEWLELLPSISGAELSLPKRSKPRDVTLDDGE